MPLQSYRQLAAWRCAAEMGLEIYRLTNALPSHERYGLSSQARRAATSVAANIAEGYGRSSRGDYLRHLSIALGSLRELECHLFFIERLGYVGLQQLEPASRLCDRTGRLLSRLRSRLDSSR
jgi:four helix bundle protein